MAIAAHDLALAAVHFHAGRLDEASQICEQLLVIDPNCVDALRVFGVIAYQSGKHDVAITNLRRASELSPNSAETLYNLGKCLQERWSIG